MKREEAVALLRAGPDGVAAWNERRDPALVSDLSNVDLKGIDLAGAQLGNVNLGGANLQGSNLQDADLSRTILTLTNLRESCLISAKLVAATVGMADLRGAKCDSADLTGAILGQADLREASFAQADFGGAVLPSTNLAKANLAGASFRSTVFNDAIVSGAILERCVVGYTLFANTDLSGVEGLDTIQHDAPSTVGLDTLVRSEGRIPEIFLRGCGVPDEIIAYLPSLLGALNPVEFYSCFISYSSKDKNFATKLHDALRSIGVRCWLDMHQLRPGVKWHSEVTRAIQSHDRLLLVLSESSIESKWVRVEIQKAREVEQKTGRAVLFPVCIDDAVFSAKTTPELDYIRQIHVADFREWHDDHSSFQRAISSVVRALAVPRSAEAGGGQ